mmetsp:Transcript_14841/g.46016  ORF Transcript_14841/g.46016 Transcript_14841/m.46016 type:complete len:447 (-) Transcript_14841:783-2123(-)
MMSSHLRVRTLHADEGAVLAPLLLRLQPLVLRPRLELPRANRLELALDVLVALLLRVGVRGEGHRRDSLEGKADGEVLQVQLAHVEDGGEHVRLVRVDVGAERVGRVLRDDGVELEDALHGEVQVGQRLLWQHVQLDAVLGEVRDEGLLLRRQEHQGAADRARTRGTADTVDVLGGVRRGVVLQNPVDARDVETTRGDVGAEEDAVVPLLERFEGREALPVLHLAVKHEHLVVEPRRAHHHARELRARHRRAEDHRLALLRDAFQEGIQGHQAVVRGHDLAVLPQRRRDRLLVAVVGSGLSHFLAICRRQLHRTGVRQVDVRRGDPGPVECLRRVPLRGDEDRRLGERQAGELPHGLAVRRGEEQRLARGGQRLQDAVEVTLEAVGQETIGLVHDEVRQRPADRPRRRVLHVVEQAAGRADGDVASKQALALLAHLGTTGDELARD